MMQQFISNGFYKHKTLRLTKASLIKTTITTVIVAKTTTTTLKITHFAVELPSFVIVATAIALLLSVVFGTRCSSCLWLDVCMLQEFQVRT